MILSKLTKKSGGAIYVNPDMVETLEYAEGGGSLLNMFSGKVVHISESPKDLIIETPEGVDVVGGWKEC